MATGPRRNGAFRDGQLIVRDNQLRINFELRSKASAIRACTKWCVERERARLKGLEGETVLKTCKMLGIRALTLRMGIRQVNELKYYEATAKAQRSLDGVVDSLPCRRLHLQSIDNHFDCVLLLLLQRRHFSDCVNGAVYTEARISLNAESAN